MLDKDLREELKQAYKALVDMPFPKLGYSIDDFVYFDSTLAGLVSSYLGGEKLTPQDVPQWDPVLDRQIKKYFEKLGDSQVDSLLAYVQAMHSVLRLLELCVHQGKRIAAVDEDCAGNLARRQPYGGKKVIGKEEPGSIKLVHTLPKGKLPWESETLVVFVPHGSGALRLAWGPGENWNEGFLLLNDLPLLYWQSSICPTCEQLLGAGYGRDKLDDDTVESLKAASQHPDEIIRLRNVTTIEPLLNLLPPGLYGIANIPHYPTDGEGRFFWDVSVNPHLFRGLSYSYRGDCGPAFLYPTQTRSRFDPQQVERYMSQPETHFGGLAYYLDSFTSALLDGHHRATASCLLRKPLQCLTIVDAVILRGEAPFWNRNQVPVSEVQILGRRVRGTDLPREVVRWLERQPQRRAALLSEECVRYYKDLCKQSSIDNQPFPTALARAAWSFPTVEGMEAISSVSDLSDEMINSLLNAPEETWQRDEALTNSLEAMIALNDPRAYALARRIALDRRWARLWRSAYRFLAAHPSPETDEVFLSFCIDDDGSHPDVAKIVNDYCAAPLNLDTVLS